MKGLSFYLLKLLLSVYGTVGLPIQDTIRNKRLYQQNEGPIQ